MKKPVNIILNGIIKENPVLTTMLGMCPLLAVTTTAANGLGLGFATIFVLICSNFTISLLNKIIPDQVRLPCYIVTIAGFVTFADKMIGAFVPVLYSSLGIFLPLITVNCIILGRAELFASKNNPFLSALDGLGMGFGFTWVLFFMGAIREILGSGTFLAGTSLAVKLPFLFDNPVMLFIFPAGGFFTFAMIIAVVNKLSNKPPREIGCANCPSKNICNRNNQANEAK
ncbi:MAG: electron transport complex subunit E [Oscillospiraceae bacterium]|nr:electron transport complex subunit E [Oscillospiraceae bacterium]